MPTRLLRLSRDAEQDILEILAHSEENFGDVARRRYEALLFVAMNDIATDPERLGSWPRPEIADSIRSYHLVQSRNRVPSGIGLVQRPRHFLLYRIAQPERVGVGRVLHERMDVLRHIPEDYGDT